MSRISQVFQKARKKGEKVFIPFITAGDPDFEITRQLCLIFEEKGADIIELGVPFSDPLADGPVIQRASKRSLSKGTTLKMICEFVKRLRNNTQLPIALMSYYNPIISHGLDVAFAWMNEAGVDGLICPDLPPEEGEELIILGREYDIATVFFLAPTSTRKRIELVAKKATGFIYYVSVTGVTGPRERLPLTIKDHLRQIKAITDVPIVVGFGISNPEQAAELVAWADGVIVGSAIIKILEKGNFSENTLYEAGEFVSKIKNSI